MKQLFQRILLYCKTNLQLCFCYSSTTTTKNNNHYLKNRKTSSSSSSLSISILLLLRIIQTILSFLRRIISQFYRYVQHRISKRTKDDDDDNDENNSSSDSNSNNKNNSNNNNNNNQQQQQYTIIIFYRFLLLLSFIGIILQCIQIPSKTRGSLSFIRKIQETVLLSSSSSNLLQRKKQDQKKNVIISSNKKKQQQQLSLLSSSSLLLLYRSDISNILIKMKKQQQYTTTSSNFVYRPASIEKYVSDHAIEYELNATDVIRFINTSSSTTIISSNSSTENNNNNPNNNTKEENNNNNETTTTTSTTSSTTNNNNNNNNIQRHHQRIIITRITNNTKPSCEIITSKTSKIYNKVLDYISDLEMYNTILLNHSSLSLDDIRIRLRNELQQKQQPIVTEETTEDTNENEYYEYYNDNNDPTTTNNIIQYEICQIVKIDFATIFRTSRQLSFSSKIGYIEPLLPPLRHPNYCFISNPKNHILVTDHPVIITTTTNSDNTNNNTNNNNNNNNSDPDNTVISDQQDIKEKYNLLRLDYIIHDFYTMCIQLKPYSRIIFIDIGASLFFHGNDIVAPTFHIINLFEQYGLPFDHIYAYEAVQQNPQQVWDTIPTRYYSKYHWMNIAVTSEINHPYNPLTLIGNTYTPDDLIIMKLDIDTPIIEMNIVNEILANTTYHNLIDHLYFENHVQQYEMIPYWGMTDINGSVYDSIQLFTKLRQVGIGAHYWV